MAINDRLPGYLSGHFSGTRGNDYGGGFLALLHLRYVRNAGKRIVFPGLYPAMLVYRLFPNFSLSYAQSVRFTLAAF